MADRPRADVPPGLAVTLRAEFFDIHNELRAAGSPDIFALVGAIQYLIERAYAAGLASVRTGSPP